jgi:tetratricopeptide (TPR) repeat protein
MVSTSSCSQQKDGIEWITPPHLENKHTTRVPARSHEEVEDYQMELTLDLQQKSRVRVLCNARVSHTFDLQKLLLPDKKAVQDWLKKPEVYGKRVYAALFPWNSLARRVLKNGPVRLLLVALQAAVATVPWEFAYGPCGNGRRTVDFLVRVLPFERGLPPHSRIPPALVNEGLQLFNRVHQSPQEDEGPLLARMVSTMAKISYRLGQTQQARALYSEALAIYREVGDRPGEADTLLQLGNAFCDTWKIKQMQAFYDEARCIYRELGNRAGEAAVLIAEGEMYLSLDSGLPNPKIYGEALAIYRELGDRVGEANALYNVAAGLQGSGSKQRALELFTEALAIQREVGNRVGEASALEDLAGLYRQLQHYAEALAAYDAFVQVEKDRSSALGAIRGLIFKALLLQKDLNRPADALQALDQALALFPATNWPSLHATTERIREKILQDLPPNQQKTDELVV